jgi:glucose dehydrogenase
MRPTDFLKTRWTPGTVAMLVAAGLTLSQPTTHGQQSQGRRVDDGVLRNAGTGGEDWLTYGLDPGQKRYSPLTQIDASNVTRLGNVWSFDIPGGTTALPASSWVSILLWTARCSDLEIVCACRCACLTR